MPATPQPTGWIVREREQTATGVFIERLTGVYADGRERDHYRVRRDETHYTLARTRRAAMDAAVRGGLDVERPALVYVTETRTRHMFDPRSGTR